MTAVGSSPPLEHQRHHRRRRRLAVRAGDRDADAQPHQLGQHLGARDHRDVPRARLDDLRVVRRRSPTTRPRRRRRRRARASCPIATRHAQRREPIGDLRSLRVRSAHAIAEIDEQLGNAAHADAADPDEVHVSRPSKTTSAPRFPLRPRQLHHPIDDPRGRIRPRQRAHRGAHSRRRACDRRAGRRPPSASTGPESSLFEHHRRRARVDEHLARSCAGGRRSPPETARAPPAVRPPRARRASSRPRGTITRSADLISRATGSRKDSARAAHPGAPVGFAHGGQVAFAGLVHDFETGRTAAPAPAPPPPWPR